MLLGHKDMLQVDETVWFRYSGKHRAGRVEEIQPNFFLLDCGENKPKRERYRRFTWDKVEGAAENHTGISVVR